jgi:uncharacterized protein (DUF305 family)
MHAYKSMLLAASLVLTSAGAGFAQTAMAGHDMAAMGSGEPTLPEICITEAGKSAAASMPTMDMGDTMNVDEGHMALMIGMDAMNKDMMTGAMADDIDVAFVCGMLPHHLGAINMAKAELQYGKNDWARQLAQKVIDAQEKEIAEMTDWLNGQKK